MNCHRYTYISSLLNLSPISLTIPPLLVGTEALFEISETYSKSPLAIYFTYGNVSVPVILAIHLTLSAPLPMSISLFSLSVSPLLPWKSSLWYHLSIFYIYALVYDIYLSLYECSGRSSSKAGKTLFIVLTCHELDLYSKLSGQRGPVALLFKPLVLRSLVLAWMPLAA